MKTFCLAIALQSIAVAGDGESEVDDIGSRRELFVDRFLIDQMDNTELQLQTPRQAEKVFVLDKPWEGRHGCRRGI